MKIVTRLLALMNSPASGAQPPDVRLEDAPRKRLDKAAEESFPTPGGSFDLWGGTSFGDSAMTIQRTFPQAKRSEPDEMSSTGGVEILEVNGVRINQWQFAARFFFGRNGLVHVMLTLEPSKTFEEVTAAFSDLSDLLRLLYAEEISDDLGQTILERVWACGGTDIGLIGVDVADKSFLNVNFTVPYQESPDLDSHTGESNKVGADGAEDEVVSLESLLSDAASLERSGEWQQALMSFELAEEDAAEAGNKMAMALCLFGKARALRRLGRQGDAIREAEMGLAFANDSDAQLAGEIRRFLGR